MSFVLGGQWKGNKGTGTAQGIVRIGLLRHVEITRLAVMSLPRGCSGNFGFGLGSSDR